MALRSTYEEHLGQHIVKRQDQDRRNLVFVFSVCSLSAVVARKTPGRPVRSFSSAQGRRNVAIPARDADDLDSMRTGTIDYQVAPDRPESDLQLRPHQIVPHMTERGASGQHFDGSEETVPQPLSGVGASPGNVIHDLKQILFGRWREDAPAHGGERRASMRLVASANTSSVGIVSPRANASRPNWTSPRNRSIRCSRDSSSENSRRSPSRTTSLAVV